MNIVYSKHAAKAISGMDSATKQRIWGGICKIPEGDIKPMKGYADGRQRLRIEKYRVLFMPTGDGLYVIAIGSRGDIYK